MPGNDAACGRFHYQLGVALIAELHTWRTVPTDTHSNHRRFLGRAIVRNRWRTVLAMDGVTSG